MFIFTRRDGTPLLVVKVKNLNKDADSKAMQKMILIVCDLMAELAPEKQCMTVVSDLEGFSISNNVDFNKLKDCINVLKACLPEGPVPCLCAKRPLRPSR